MPLGISQFNSMSEAAINEAVCPGTCVIVAGSELVYAGPLRTAPFRDGQLVMLSAEDFAVLRGHLRKRMN